MIFDTEELVNNEIGCDQIDRNNIEITDTNDLQSSGLISVLGATYYQKKIKLKLLNRNI